MPQRKALHRTGHTGKGEREWQPEWKKSLYPIKNPRHRSSIRRESFLEEWKGWKRNKQMWYV